MTNAHTCARCGAAMTDHAHICHDCTQDLATDLRHAGGWYERDPRSPIGRRWIPGLLQDLLTTATHTDAITPRTTNPADDGLTLDARYPVVISEAATPGHLAALTAHRQLTAVLADAARRLLPLVHDRPTRGYLTLWLTDHLDTIRRHDWSHPLADQLQHAVQRAEQLVDRPTAAVTIACKCGRRVPIDPDTELIRCPCSEWGTLQWWRDNHAPTEPTGPITLVAAQRWMLVEHTLDIPLETLRTWAKRGQMTETGRDDRGHKLYDHLVILDTARRKTTA